MLKALGSAERVTVNQPCCDVCDGNRIPAPLHFEAFPSSTLHRRTRRAAIRIIDEGLMTELKKNLEAEREAYMHEHPSFQMLGRNFVCADSVIDKICLEAKYIASTEDLNNIVIGAEIKSRFLRVILSTFAVTPTPRLHHN